MGLLKETAHSYYSGNDLGSYQFISLDHIINNFMIAYVGEGKIVPKIKRTDVSFHAQRALQELSYDTLKSCKSIEVEVCGNLKVPLPQDYVNYVKLTSSDSAGIEHTLYPISKTSNPLAIEQTDEDCTDCGDTSSTYQYDAGSLKPQEIDCGTEDVTCVFVPADSNLPGANQVKQAFESGGSLHSYTTEQKISYWNGWFGNVDTYCNCLKNSNSEDNCGDQLSWDNFDIDASNMVSEMNNNAGWSGLRYPIVNSNISRTQAVNGSWNSFTNTVTLSTESSNTWDNYKGNTPSENQDDYQDNSYWPNLGARYGLDPIHANANGSFFIDCNKGLIHFSSNISGKTVILKYISDGLGTDGEMIVHKFAEEAMYKSIAYAILSTTISGQPLAPSFQQQKSAAIRTAKLRLSNLKIEELTQIMRGKSKFIKH